MRLAIDSPGPIRQERPMPIYKRLPTTKNNNAVPLSHPLERLYGLFWEKKRLIGRGFIVFLLLAGVGAVFFSYRSRIERKAGRILEEREWSASEEALKYPRTRAAAVARLSLGQRAIEGKDWDRAIEYYEPLTGSAEPMIRVAALQNLALAYRGKGDFEKALNELKRAENDPENADPELTRYFTALLLEEKGDREEALKILEEIAGKEGVLKGDAEEKLKWLKKSRKPR